MAKKLAANRHADRDLHRMKVQLSMRERQFALVLSALKKIVQFNSAHSSVFQTEVHYLQMIALSGLTEAHELQTGKKVARVQDRRTKEFMNRLYGRFSMRPLSESLYGLLSETDGD